MPYCVTRICILAPAPAAVARRSIGYCPQFDALYEHLTAREHLNFYGAVRGVSAQRLPLMVNALLTNLALDEYADRVAGTFSGGNKRKLSVAIALIGSPPVVFLDEVRVRRALESHFQ